MVYDSVKCIVFDLYDWTNVLIVQTQLTVDYIVSSNAIKRNGFSTFFVYYHYWFIVHSRSILAIHWIALFSFSIFVIVDTSYPQIIYMLHLIFKSFDKYAVINILYYTVICYFDMKFNFMPTLCISLTHLILQICHVWLNKNNLWPPWTY